MSHRSRVEAKSNPTRHQQFLPGSEESLHKRASRTDRLLCIGQLTLDTIITLRTRLAVGDQSLGDFRLSMGGTAAIVAHNAVALGGPAAFAGHVGASPEDEGALRHLERVGVAIESLIATPQGARVVVMVEATGERTMVSSGASPDWSRLDRKFIRPTDIAYFEGWHLFDLTRRKSYADLIRAARLRGALVALDVCSATRATDQSDFRSQLGDLGVDILLANAEEGASYELIDKPLAPLTVVHRGSQPTLVSLSGSVTPVPVDRAQVSDTTGAGDTFAAGFLGALVGGQAPLEAIRLGHAAARLVVGVTGALLPANPTCGSRAKDERA